MLYFSLSVCLDCIALFLGYHDLKKSSSIVNDELFTLFVTLPLCSSLCTVGNLQIDGKIEDVCSPYPIDKKFEAFNFHVINVADGNDFDQLKAAFDEAKTVKGMPTAIVMKTVKGKGVSYMENSVDWHGKAPNDELLEKALTQNPETELKDY